METYEPAEDPETRPLGVIPTRRNEPQNQSERLGCPLSERWIPTVKEATQIIILVMMSTVSESQEISR